MEYRLDDSHPVYIRMTVTGVVDKPHLIAAMSHLMQHPDYPARHSLWDFTGAAMGISIGDLSEIAGVHWYPRKFTGRTVAFAKEV